MVRSALEAADLMAKDGISCEVIDLRSLAPLDMTLITSSVERTSALVTIEEGQITCGIGAEIITRLQEALSSFKAMRIGALAAPISSNPVLEAVCLPDKKKISDAIRLLMRER